MISESGCSKQATDTDMQSEPKHKKISTKMLLDKKILMLQRAHITVPADGHVMETIMGLNESEH